MARAKSTTPAAAAPAEPKTPTEQLFVGIMGMAPSEQRDAAVMSTIDAFARGLVEQGKRPWFEVHYPAPDHLTDDEAAEWLGRARDSFDALELVNFELDAKGRAVGGELVTLPPYAELEAKP